MTGVDFFSSTARGLFLRAGGLERGADEVPLSVESVPAGAVVLAEVVDVPARCRVGNLEIIEPAAGAADTWLTREVALIRGQKFVGAIGGRFANRSINGHAPARPAPPGRELDLLNTGGVVGLSASADQATVKLRVLGGVELGGGPAGGGPTFVSNLTSIPETAAPDEDDPAPGTPLVLIAGSDMDVGKTTCAASLALSLRASGIRVSYAKLTGTGRMRDLMKVSYGRPEGHFDSDRLGWDFVDAGLATTFEIGREEVRRQARRLLNHAALRGEVIIAEIADAPNAEGSIYVATDPWLQGWLQRFGLIVCACDSVSSTLTAQWLRSQVGLGDEEILISGLVANDPATREEVELEIGLRTVSVSAPSQLSHHGGKTQGGAMADWVIRHIMNLRKAMP